MSLPLATLYMLFGILVHFLSVLMALEDAGTTTTPWAYLKLHPYRAAFLVAISFMALLAAQHEGQLNPLSAVLVGYICQDQADRFRQRANNTSTPVISGGTP